MASAGYIRYRVVLICIALSIDALSTQVVHAWDSPCKVWGKPACEGRVGDTILDEISGIAASRTNPGIFWVHNDGGAGGGDIYGIDRQGRTLGRIHLSNITNGVSNGDWEDVTVGPCWKDGPQCVWVADIGNNCGCRDNLRLLRFEEPDLINYQKSRWDSKYGQVADYDWFHLRIEADVLPFRYPKRNTYDAEAMVVTPDGDPVLLTKHKKPKTEIFILKNVGKYVKPGKRTTMKKIGTLTLPPILDLGDEAKMAEQVVAMGGGRYNGDDSYAVTGADMWPDGSQLIIRTYGAGAYEVDIHDKSVWSVPWATVRHISMPAEPQAEAICYDTLWNRIYTVSERKNQPIYFLPCDA